MHILYYKILEYYPADRLMVVRYFTDTLSEEDLSVSEERRDGIPVRCKTDVSLSIPLPESSEFGMHKYIIQRAPTALLKKLEIEKTGTDQDYEVPNTLKLFDKVYSQTEEDIRKLLIHDIRVDAPFTDAEKAAFIKPVSNNTVLIG